MDIELRRLRSLVQMHEAGSISHAAERLACTQAAMSMRLKMLEAELGAPLLLRGPQGLQPNPWGAELYARALGALGTYDEMLSATWSRLARTRPRLGMPDDYALDWLGPALTEVALDRAEVGNTCDLLAHLVAAVQRLELDLALVTMAARPVQTLAEGRVPLVWVGSAPKGAQVGLAAYPEGCVFRRAMIAALERAGQNWRVAVQRRAHAGIFVDVPAVRAVTCVARGAAPADLAEYSHLPALPEVSLYLIGPKTAPRGVERDLRAALLRQIGLTAVSA